MARQADPGFSLVEATIVLLAFAVLTGFVAPSASRALDRARQARAVDDAEAIKTAVVNFRADVFQGFTESGTVAGDLVEMLVSDGDTPRDASIADDNGAAAGVRMRWDDPVGDSDVGDVGPAITVDFLENHLVRNNVLGLGISYPLSGGTRWRGAYLNAPLDPDPWGNRYAVNTGFLLAPANTKNDTIVLSAGPDEEIDTLFEKDGMRPGDDDIVVMVLRDRNSNVP